jgi:hypothetical protein
MELREALVQIAEIRRHMASSGVFRGYRSAPVALSGVFALAAALVQARLIPEPAEHFNEYLTLWIATAALSMLAVAAEMVMRLVRTQQRGDWELTRLAIEQFLPCIIAGGLLTLALVRQMPEQVALLPGLWQIMFSLGIFASARLLPKQLFVVGAFYLCSGVVVLIWGHDGFSLEPWCMGIPFVAGQLAAAAILYWTLERGT